MTDICATLDGVGVGHIPVALCDEDVREIRRLLREAQAGDERAFGALIRRYERRALSVARRLVGNREDALDATQDALLRLFRFINRVDGERDFGAWVYRIVVNASMDLLERRQRQAGALQDIKATLEPEDLYVTPAAESAMEGQRVGAAVANVIAALPPKERAALILRDVEGLSTREVARMLGSSEATVRSQICAARSKLRAMRALMQATSTGDGSEPLSGEGGGR